MLDDAQARLVMLLLLSVVTAAAAFGFVSALRSGSVSVRRGINSAPSKIVRRADNPGYYWCLIAGWAFMLVLCLGLFGILVFLT